MMSKLIARLLGRRDRKLAAVGVLLLGFMGLFCFTPTAHAAYSTQYVNNLDSVRTSSVYYYPNYNYYDNAQIWYDNSLIRSSNDGIWTNDHYTIRSYASVNSRGTIKHSNGSAIMTITLPNYGYTIENRKVDMIISITEVTMQGGDAYTAGQDNWFLEIAKDAKYSMPDDGWITIEAPDFWRAEVKFTIRLEYAGTNTLVPETIRSQSSSFLYEFNDIDAVNCIAYGYPGNWDYQYSHYWNEQIHRNGNGFDDVAYLYKNSSTSVVLPESNHTSYRAKDDDEGGHGTGDYDPEGTVIFHGKNNASFTWRGTSCGTILGINGRVKTYRYETPTKAPATQTVKKGAACSAFTIKQWFPAVSADNQPKKIEVTDTFDNAFDLSGVVTSGANATVSVKRGNTTLTGWTCTKSGQTITFSTTNTAHSDSGGNAEGELTFTINGVKVKSNANISTSAYPISSDGKHRTITNKATTKVTPKSGSATEKTTGTVNVLVPFFKVHYMWQKQGEGNFVEKYTEAEAYEGNYTTKTFSQASFNQTSGYSARGYATTTTSTTPVSWEGITSPGSATILAGETWLWATESQNPVTVHYMWKGIHDNAFHEVEAARVVRVPPGTYKTKNFVQATISATEGCTAVGYAQTTSGTATPTTFNQVIPGGNATVNAETWFWATENWDPIPIHYMWKANGSTYTEVASEILDAPTNSYRTKTLSGANITPTVGYAPTSWKKTLAGNSNPSLDAYADGTINPGATTEITPHETWLWATEKYNCFDVHYMWRADGEVDFVEKKTDEDAIGGPYTILSLENANITPTEGCTAVAYGLSDDGYPPSSLNTNAAGSSVNLESEIWLWASEDRNTYPVHYMWKPNGADSYSQVAQESNVPYGTYMTLPLSDANITPTSGYSAVGYGQSNTATAPSSLNAVNPGGSTQVTGETWLWATESQLTFPVHYMWRSKDATTFTEVGQAAQELPGDYVIKDPSAAGITPSTGYSVVAYGMTSENAAPSDDQLSGHPAGQTVDLTGETWFWATEDLNAYTVHYMFKSSGARNYVEKKKVQNVPYGTYPTLALADANINQSDGCTITAYGQTLSNSAPDNLSSVTPTENTQITGETWLWARETLNTYPVHYMWRGDGDTTYREVLTDPEVPHGTYSTEPISALNVTQTPGSTVSAYGKTTSNSAPADDQLSAVRPTNATTITGETWLWASEELNKMPVHYMWKGANDADYSEVKTANVPIGNYQTETLSGLGISATNGYETRAYGETTSDEAPSDLNDLTPGDTIPVEQEIWLWASEVPLSYPVHYMWKGHSSSDYIEVKTDPNVPYGTYTTKSFADASIVAAQGYTPKGYGKTTSASAPTNLTQVTPASQTNITGETWLWATEDVNTYPVHYMWKPSGATSYTEVFTVPDAPYGTYQTLSLNNANITPSDGCTPAAYGKTSNATAPAVNSDVNPGSSFNLTGETWLWASEDNNTYTVHYMWKPDGATSYREVHTVSNVPYGSYSVLQTSAAKITPSAGCTLSAYGLSTSTTAPSNLTSTAPGANIRVTGDVWLWASEVRDTFPVHYMYSTGSWTDWKEVKVVENVPYGSYKTLNITQLGVTPEYPNLVDGYGKTTANSVPDDLFAATPGGTTQIKQETWLWAMEDPLIHGSQVTTYKSADPANNTPVSVGQEITYKLTHINTGAATSAYTLVRDYIPEGVEYVEGSVSDGGVYVDASTSANGKAYVEWVKTSIPPRGSVESSFKVKVLDNPPRVILNYALTSTQDTPITPGDPSNAEPKDESNEVQHPTSEGVKTPPQIEIVKSSVPSPGIKVSAGKVIDYTLKVTNTGGNEAKEIAVYDAVPQYTTLVGFSTEYSGQASGNGVGWNIPSLDSGKSVELHMSVMCAQDDGVIIANQASYCRNTPGIPSGPLPNTTNIVEHPTSPENIITGAQVTTYKSADPESNSKVEVGQEITYTLTHKNTGAVTSPYTLVRDYIPEGVEYVEGSVSEGGVYVAAENSASGRAYVEWVKFGIPVGEQVQSYFKVKVSENPPSIIRNHALTGTQETPLVPGDPNNPDPALMSNEVRHTTDGSPCGPQIQIVKSANPEPGTIVAQGNVIAYTLEVTNIGDEVAHNIGVYDDVPAMTQLVDFEAVQNCTVLYEGRALGWNIAELGPGGSTTLSFRVIVTEQGHGGQKIANCASYAMDVDGIPQGPLGNTSNIVEHPFAPDDNVQAMIMATKDAFPLLLVVVVAGLASGAVIGMKMRRKAHK